MTVITPSAPASLPQAATASQDALFLEKARAFEASFLTPMVDEMLRSVGPASFGAGHAEEMWRSVLAGAIAQKIADSDTTGIAPSLAQQMKAYGG